MSDTVLPGAQRVAVFVGVPSGRAVGEITLEVFDPVAGAVSRVASADGIVETPAGNGTSSYAITYAAPATAATWIERWTDTVPNPAVVVDDELVVAWTAIGPPPGPSYATPDALRSELLLTPADLTDDAATRLLADAEDRVDELIGPSSIDVATGRKVVVANLEPWQALKLQRATVILAATAQRDPNAFTTPRYASIDGPDFKKSQPIGSGLPGATKLARRQAANQLSDAGLRVVGVRAAAGVGGVPVNVRGGASAY